MIARFFDHMIKTFYMDRYWIAILYAYFHLDFFGIPGEIVSGDHLISVGIIAVLLSLSYRVKGEKSDG